MKYPLWCLLKEWIVLHMPPKNKIPITDRVRFYERIPGSVDPCPMCVEHKYIIVQKFPMSQYGMHTLVARGARDNCMHLWNLRTQDPVCLSSYAPTDYFAPSLVKAGTLRQEIILAMQERRYGKKPVRNIHELGNNARPVPRRVQYVVDNGQEDAPMPRRPPIQFGNLDVAARGEV